jgi:hypothetical protein
MQDADQAVGQGPQGLVVGGATAAELVVVGPGAWERVRALKAHS